MYQETATGLLLIELEIYGRGMAFREMNRSGIWPAGRHSIYRIVQVTQKTYTKIKSTVTPFPLTSVHTATPEESPNGVYLSNDGKT